MSGATLPDGPIPPSHRMVWAYAGFWWRVLAYLLDAVILSLLSVPIMLVLGAVLGALGLRPPGTAPAQQMPSGDDAPVSHVSYTVATTVTPHAFHGEMVIMLVSLLVPFLYHALLESSRWQATPGKRACGIRVTDLSGRRIGFGRASGRFFGKIVSAALFGIGFLMVGWTRRKQGLHDLMAATLVMRRREADPAFTFNEPIN